MAKTGGGRFEKAVAAALLAAVAALSCFALFGCTGKKMTVAEMTETLGVENLASKATVRTDAGDDAFPYTGSDYGSVDFSFSTEFSFNAVALSERSSSVDDFEILVESGGRWSSIYRQDFIREFRYCVFPRVRATAVKMRFQSENGEFTIAEVGIYDVPDSVRDFHAVSYLLVDSFLDFEAFEEGQGIESFLSVTDVILFGGATFRSDGTLEISPDLDVALSNLKQVEVALDKRFNIYCNFLNSEKEYLLGAFDTYSDQYVTAMKSNRETLCENFDDFVAYYAFDGVAFDWEFPRRISDWKVFSDFVATLDGVLEPGKRIAAAVTGREASLSKAAVEAIDLVTVRSYDLPDDTGSHASFGLAWKDAARLEAIGVPRRKICVGIPFYARETHGDPIWFPYNETAFDLGQEYNMIQNTVTWQDGSSYTGKRFYNGYLMVRDKTAFAYDTGMGGVMFWNHTLDADYDAAVNGKSVSLLRAVGETLSFRK